MRFRRSCGVSPAAPLAAGAPPPVRAGGSCCCGAGCFSVKDPTAPAGAVLGALPRPPCGPWRRGGLPLSDPRAWRD
eukprot:355676-Chlamydomonas_euryale.AAC.8